MLRTSFLAIIAVSFSLPALAHTPVSKRQFQKVPLKVKVDDLTEQQFRDYLIQLTDTQLKEISKGVLSIHRRLGKKMTKTRIIKKDLYYRRCTKKKWYHFLTSDDGRIRSCLKFRRKYEKYFKDLADYMKNEVDRYNVIFYGYGDKFPHKKLQAAAHELRLQYLDLSEEQNGKMLYYSGRKERTSPRQRFVMKVDRKIHEAMEERISDDITFRSTGQTGLKGKLRELNTWRHGMLCSSFNMFDSLKEARRVAKCVVKNNGDFWREARREVRAAARQVDDFRSEIKDMINNYTEIKSGEASEKRCNEVTTLVGGTCNKNAGGFKLLARTKTNKEVWKSTETGLIWSDAMENRYGKTAEELCKECTNTENCGGLKVNFRLPTVDEFETEDRYYFRGVLPGFFKDDLMRYRGRSFATAKSSRIEGENDDTRFAYYADDELYFFMRSPEYVRGRIKRGAGSHVRCVAKE